MNKVALQKVDQIELIDKGLVARCPKHGSYTRVYQPKIKCKDCVTLYNHRHPEKQVEPKDPPCNGSGYAHAPHGDCSGYTYDRT